MSAQKKKQSNYGVARNFNIEENSKIVSMNVINRNVGENSMDDLLKTYIEKVDKDQSELKTDMREREERTEKYIAESENRINMRFDKLEQMIENQNAKMDSLKDEMQKQIVEEKRYRHTNNIAIVLGVIATILAMVGIYYATISTITNMIGLITK